VFNHEYATTLEQGSQPSAGRVVRLSRLPVIAALKAV
jgi:hypothetical protein